MAEFRFVQLADVRLRVAVEGRGPLVLMVHGFPESWYSWRHQMTPVAEAGFTAAALDARGYGGSDKPFPVEAYAMEHMVADVVGVIEALSPGASAIIAGHDWGAPIVWNSALIRPDRVRAVCGLSVPYMGVPSRPFSAVFDEVFTKRNKFFYQAYFQKEGVAEAEAERDIRGFLRKFYYALCGEAPDGSWPSDKTADATLLQGLVDPDPFPSWLSAADLDYYVGEFARSGLRGPLNRYRNHERDFAFLRRFEGRKIEQPALFIGGERDLVLTMFGRTDFAAAMRGEIPDLRGSDVLEGCGHWTQQERPRAVNDRLLAWLKSL